MSQPDTDMHTVNHSGLSPAAVARHGETSEQDNTTAREDSAAPRGSGTTSPGSSRQNQSSPASHVAGGGIGGDESVAHASPRAFFAESNANDYSEYVRLHGLPEDTTTSWSQDDGAMKGGWGFAGNKNLTKEEMANIVAVSRMKWGSDPQMFTCPYCQHEDYSANHMEHTPFVWTGVAVMCALGCWFGCCLAPLCSDRIKNVRHQCAKCHRVVGYRRACGTCRVGVHKTCCCGRDEFVEYIAELEHKSSQLQPSADPPRGVVDDQGQKLYTL